MAGEVRFAPDLYRGTARLTPHATRGHLTETVGFAYELARKPAAA